jgi:hypothetical protein
MDSKKLKSITKLISGLILFAAVGFALYLLIKGNTLAQLSKVRFNPNYLLLSFIIAYAGTLFGAIPAWRQILMKNGVHQPIQKDVCIYCYSTLGSVLPGRIWTVASRATFYQQLNGSGLTVTLASILENVVVGIAAFIMYTVITIIQPQISLWADHPWIGYCIAVGSMILIHPKIFQRIISFLLKLVRPGKTLPVGNYQVGDLLRWILFEAVVTFLGGISIFVLLESVLPVSFQLLIPILAAWAAGVSIGTLFFWLPGSLVLRDGAMVIILSSYLTPTTAILFVVIMRIWVILSVLLLAGLVWLLLDRNKQKATL